MKPVDKTNPNIKLVKEELASYLGIEPEDIEMEDNLIEDLHMRPTDLTDFVEILNSKGIDTSGLDMTQVETFADLIESLELDYE